MDRDDNSSDSYEWKLKNNRLFSEANAAVIYQMEPYNEINRLVHYGIIQGRKEPKGSNGPCFGVMRSVETITISNTNDYPCWGMAYLTYPELKEALSLCHAVPLEMLEVKTRDTFVGTVGQPSGDEGWATIHQTTWWEDFCSWLGKAFQRTRYFSLELHADAPGQPSIDQWAELVKNLPKETERIIIDRVVGDIKPVLRQVSIRFDNLMELNLFGGDSGSPQTGDFFEEVALIAGDRGGASSLRRLVVSNMTTKNPPKALSALFTAASRNPYLLECRFEAIYWYREANHDKNAEDMADDIDDDTSASEDLFILDPDIKDACNFGYYLDRVRRLLLLPRSNKDKYAGLGYEEWKQTVYYMRGNNDYVYALCRRWITYSISMVKEGAELNTRKRRT